MGANDSMMRNDKMRYLSACALVDEGEKCDYICKASFHQSSDEWEVSKYTSHTCEHTNKVEGWKPSSAFSVCQLVPCVIALVRADHFIKTKVIKAKLNEYVKLDVTNSLAFAVRQAAIQEDVGEYRERVCRFPALEDVSPHVLDRLASPHNHVS